MTPGLAKGPFWDPKNNHVGKDKGFTLSGEPWNTVIDLISLILSRFLPPATTTRVQFFVLFHMCHAYFMQKGHLQSANIDFSHHSYRNLDSLHSRFHQVIQRGICPCLANCRGWATEIRLCWSWRSGHFVLQQSAKNWFLLDGIHAYKASSMYTVVQLNFYHEIEVFHMPFDGYLSIPRTSYGILPFPV